MQPQQHTIVWSGHNIFIKLRVDANFHLWLKPPLVDKVIQPSDTVANTNLWFLWHYNSAQLELKAKSFISTQRSQILSLSNKHHRMIYVSLPVGGCRILLEVVAKRVKKRKGKNKLIIKYSHFFSEVLSFFKKWKDDTKQS